MVAADIANTVLGFTAGPDVGILGIALQGAKVGKIGIKTVTSNGIQITGFTKHGVNRMIGNVYNRAGVSQRAFIDAIKNPNRIVTGVDNYGRPINTFYGASARITINRIRV